MTGRKEEIINIMKKEMCIDISIIDKIIVEKNSPLLVACDLDLPQSNDINHSLKILKNIIMINKKISDKKLKLSKKDFLILVYSALLHDISKSQGVDNIKDLEKLRSRSSTCTTIPKPIIHCCKYIEDHGVLSSHYIEWKIKVGQIITIGLNKKDVKKLLSIISFHNLGVIHSCYSNEEFERKDLFLHFLFWLSDIADGSNGRALSSRLTDLKSQSKKSKARLKVKNIKLNEKNQIIWDIEKNTREIMESINLCNRELSKHCVLLQAFGLPSQIISSNEHKLFNSKIGISDLEKYNISINVSTRESPLVISSDTIKEVYSKIANSFNTIRAENTPNYLNYYGPILIEIRNVQEDMIDEIEVNNSAFHDICKIKEYTRDWENPCDNASDVFYFGYTHGQRINQYIYPHDGNDLQILDDIKKRRNENQDKNYPQYSRIKLDISKWSDEGRISQIDRVIEILKKEGNNCRRAFIVIPNLIIDNPNSKFYIPDVAAPALLAIHFMIEKDDKLSGFALLRAQELSTLFLVNYLEVKNLLNKIITEMRKDPKYTHIHFGRIIMFSAFGYFDPNTVLLDKPILCKKRSTDLRMYGKDITNPVKRRELIELLEEFKKNFIVIEYEWCEILIESLKNKNIQKELDKVKKALIILEQNRSIGGLSISDEVKYEKNKAIDDLIKLIKKEYQ